MNAGRISKVTDKRTGRSIHVLRDPRPKDEVAASLLSNAGAIAENYGDTIDAYAIVALHRDGTYQAGWRCRGFYQPTNTTAILKEVITREIVTQTEAVEVYNRGSDE